MLHYWENLDLSYNTLYEPLKKPIPLQIHLQMTWSDKCCIEHNAHLDVEKPLKQNQELPVSNNLFQSFIFQSTSSPANFNLALRCCTVKAAPIVDILEKKLYTAKRFLAVYALILKLCTAKKAIWSFLIIVNRCLNALINGPEVVL